MFSGLKRKMNLFDAKHCQPNADTARQLPVFCRDRGMKSSDEGALCLSLSYCEDSFGQHKTTTVSRSHEDRHKAPALPHIHPLSLQRYRSRRDSSRPYMRILTSISAVFCIVIVLVVSAC